MSLKAVRAILECDACGDEFKVILDPALEINGASISDAVDEEVRSMLDMSIQHDMHLCTTCTRVADQIGDEDNRPSREEILKAVGAIG